MTNEPVKQARQEWIKALRSGDYKQGRGQLLSDSNRYCCLGVACVINDVPLRYDDVLKGIEPHSNSMELGISFLEEYVETLPVFTKLGLTDVLEAKVSRLNDRGTSFSEIARYLEQEFAIMERLESET